MIFSLLFAMYAAAVSADLPDAMRVLDEQGCAAAETLLQSVAESTSKRGDRMTATLALARCASNAGRAEELYRMIVAERRVPLEGDDELIALTALNELAALLIRGDRTQDAAALYDVPPPRDALTLLSHQYSGAVADTAAGNRDRALGKLLQVIERDPLFASASDLTINLLGSSSVETVASNLPGATAVLDRAGLHDDVARAIAVVLARSDICNDALQRAAGRAFLEHAALVRSVERVFATTWQPRMTTCRSLREISAAFSAMTGDDAARIPAAAKQLGEYVPLPQVTQIIRNAALNDRFAERDRVAQAKYFAISELEPANVYALSEAASIARANPQSGDPEQIMRYLERAAPSLSTEARANVYLQLGHVLTDLERVGDGARAWKIAETLYGNTAVPELRMSLARAEVKLGAASAARDYVINAARDCQRLGRPTCVVSSLQEGVGLGVVSAETAIAFGIDPGTLGQPGPSLPPREPPPPRGPSTFDGAQTPFAPPSLFDVAIGKLDVTNNYTSTFPIHGNQAPANGASPSTPVENWDLLDLALGGPIMRDKLWVRASYNYRRTDRRIAGINETITENRKRAGIKWQAGSRVLVSASADEQMIGDRFDRAEPSRAIDATTNTGLRTFVMELRSDVVVGDRLNLKLRGTTLDASFVENPAAPTSNVTVLDANGIRHGSATLQNVDTSARTFVLDSSWYPTNSLHVQAGVQLGSQDADELVQASPLNAFFIERAQHADAVPFDVFRLFRSGTISRAQERQIGWLGLQFYDSATTGYAGVRYGRDRGESTSAGAAVNRFEPHFLTALGPTRSTRVRWNDIAPLVKITRVLYANRANPTTLSLWYARTVSGLTRPVVDFTNAANFTSADFVVVHNDGDFDVVRLLSAYGISGKRTDLNVVGDLVPPIRDEVGFALQRNLLGGTFAAELGVLRASRTLGTRPIVSDENGFERPARRSDYVPDRVDHGRAVAGRLYTLAPGLRYTAGYFLANEDRHREQRFLRLNWWRSGDWIWNISGRLSRAEWRIGDRYREEHDPTPIAASFDRWTFYAGSVDGTPAADDLLGPDYRSFVVPESRWRVSVSGSHEFDVPLVRALTFGGEWAASEGYVQQPYVAVYGTDGIRRHVAMSVGERLPNVTTLTLHVLKKIPIAGTKVTLKLECRSCNNARTTTRRTVQMNDARGGMEEWTLTPRTFALSATLGLD